MRIKGSKKNFWFAVVTTCLVIALVVSGVMVFHTPGVKNMVKNNATDTNVILSRGDGNHQGADLHAVDPERLQKVGEDGLAQLLFDPVSMAPVIYVPSEKQYWYAMAPVSEGEQSGQSVFTMEIAKGGDRYILNSQDNSVAMGNATASVDVSGKKITVTYIIAEKSADAEKEKARLAALLAGKTENMVESAATMAFTVAVTYTLKDGGFFAEVDCGKLQNTSSVRALSLSLLPYFGSSRGATEDGFLLVPDGPGALIDLSRSVKEFTPVELDVYGSDPSISTASEKSAGQPGAVLPAFGIRQGKGAFLALVEKGDVWSSIHAERALGGDETENKVYASFLLTSNSRTLVKGVGDKSDYYTDFMAEQPHGETLSVCYRFLTQSNASYSGMAVSCREQLMRNGTLASSTVAEEDYLPFQLTVIGQAEVRASALGIHYTDSQTLTTFEQAYDMVQQMRVKGINAINLRYIGMLEESGSAGAGLNSSLGSRKRLQALADYMKSEKLDLYLDANLLTLSKSPWNYKKSAVGLNGRPIQWPVSGRVQGESGSAVTKTYFRRMDSLGDSVESLLTNTKNWPVDGICVNDAGRLLYHDFSKSTMTLSKTKELLASQNAPLSVSHKLMVDTGNIYMLRGADAVVNMPLTSSRTSEDKSYVTVPFLQMVTHGLFDYSGPSINESADYKTAMLRAVEYGACPSFTWTYGDTSLLSPNNHTYYADWLVTATDYYAKANAVLYEVRGARITGHTEVADHVFRTVYDNRYSVYVNYNGKEVEVDGLVIPAMDFIRA